MLAFDERAENQSLYEGVSLACVEHNASGGGNGGDSNPRNPRSAHFREEVRVAIAQCKGTVRQRAMHSMLCRVVGGHIMRERDLLRNDFCSIHECRLARSSHEPSTRGVLTAHDLITPARHDKEVGEQHSVGTQDFAGQMRWGHVEMALT